MAAKRRHWKEKDGRFWAGISIPHALRPLFQGKTQLTEPLGGDLRIADQKHAAAVARLQAQIARAAESIQPPSSAKSAAVELRPSTIEDHEHAIKAHYNAVLRDDDQKRASMPTPEEIEAEYERYMRKVEAGEASPDRGIAAVFNASTDYELKASARYCDHQARTRRLAALRLALNSGNPRFVEGAVRNYIAEQKLNIQPGSSEWRDLCHKFMRAEVDALQRTLDRDEGIFNDEPTDPLVKHSITRTEKFAPVPLLRLFDDYIKQRQAVGYHLDGGGNWKNVILSLIKFLGHSDASKITKRNLLAWRDSLLETGKSPKTISDKNIAAVNAVLRWAFVNDRLPSNEAELVRQEIPKKVQLRERGYTTDEALKVLRASIGHKPPESNNPANREGPHLTAAKRWVPLLCAFTGARVTAATLTRLTAPETDARDFPSHARFALQTLPTLTTRPDQIKTLRQTILNLAVRGKLVEQDPTDEPAAVLLKRIAKEVASRRKSMGLRPQDSLPMVDESNTPFELPVGWAWARFPEVGVFARGKSKHRPRNDPALYLDGTIPFVQTGDVARSGGLITTHSSVYNETGLQQSMLWPAGTMCITIAANIADSGILTFDACFPDSVVGLVAASCFENGRFFEYFVRTAKANLTEFAPATAQKNINLGILEMVLIPLPPLAEQHRIVAKVDALMALCDQLEASLTTATTTRSRLLETTLRAALAGDQDAA